MISAFFAAQVVPFFRKWGLWVLAGLFAFGLGWGAWLYVGGLQKDRDKYMRQYNDALTEIAGYEKNEVDNAIELSYLRGRLDAEASLAQKRLEEEEARRAAEAARIGKLSGAINDLRSRLQSNAPSCSCGVGSDLTNGLRESRDSREADRIAREAAD